MLLEIIVKHITAVTQWALLYRTLLWLNCFLQVFSNSTTLTVWTYLTSLQTLCSNHGEIISGVRDTLISIFKSFCLQYFAVMCVERYVIFVLFVTYEKFE